MPCNYVFLYLLDNHKMHEISQFNFIKNHCSEMNLPPASSPTEFTQEFLERHCDIPRVPRVDLMASSSNTSPFLSLSISAYDLVPFARPSRGFSEVALQRRRAGRKDGCVRVRASKGSPDSRCHLEAGRRGPDSPQAQVRRPSHL